MGRYKLKIHFIIIVNKYKNFVLFYSYLLESLLF